MRDYQIITDTNSDLPKEYVLEKGLIQVPQYTLFEGQTYEGAEGIDPKEFYQKMAEGAMPQSQAINPAVCEEKFRKVLDEGKDILYISFSSAMSGSCNTAIMTGRDLSEEYKDATINIVDSLGASVGEGLLVMKAVELKESGMGIEELTKWLEDNKLNINIEFIVDDLKSLQRGGRVSKTTAVVGTIVGIKPRLRVDAEGKLGANGTIRGRKKSIASLVDLIGEKKTEDTALVAIAHGNCLAECEGLAATIKERYGLDSMINDINPSIGVHSGPGTIMVSFFGTAR